MSYRTVPEYPGVICKRQEIVLDLDGPASYNNTGTFATSGQVINASDFGFSAFEFVDSQNISSDNVNTVLVFMPGMSTSSAASGNNAPVSQTATIHWFVQSTGLEVANGVNLSGKSIRLQLRVV